MANVSFKRGDTATLNSTPITDGMIYFNLENKHIYMDNGSDRLEYYNDMDSFMRKAGINHLVPKYSNNHLLVNPYDMEHILGNTYIGGDTILNTIDDLYEGKSLFKVVWEDNNPLAFDTKIITIDGTYAFFIILLQNHSIGYVLAKNNTTLYDQFGYYDVDNNVDEVHTKSNDKTRKITITSDNTNTTIMFDGYGEYINGTCQSHDDAFYSVPYQIIGINN